MLELGGFGQMNLSRKTKLINLTRDLETPFFLIDINQIRKKIITFNNIFKDQEINYNLLYSVKTNYNPFILKLLNSLGVELEAISGFELDILSKLNLLNNKVVINGPAKSKEEILKAIKSNSIIQTDSLEELYEINNLCDIHSSTARVGLRFQPPGSNWKRFGIPYSNAAEYIEKTKSLSDKVSLIGLHSHLGTQILDVNAYQTLSNYLVNLAFDNDLVSQLEYINVGGGLPSYGASLTHHEEEPPALVEYINSITLGLQRLFNIRKDIKCFLEPGRAIVDESIDLISSVMASDFNRIILDTGKNDIPSINIRNHSIIPDPNISLDKLSNKQVYGCLCMRSDSFPKEIQLPDLRRGDRVLISTLGAYVNSQSMNFIKYKPPIYYYDGSDDSIKFTLLERKQTVDDLLSRFI